MARARTWNLRLNLDEFNAAFASLSDDQEKAQFLHGLSLGMNSGEPRPGCPLATKEGFALGKAMREEAEGYREGRIEIGKKGGPKSWKEPRGLPDGLPHGSGDVNQAVPPSEPEVNQGGTQSTIHNPLTPEPQSPILNPSEEPVGSSHANPGPSPLPLQALGPTDGQKPQREKAKKEKPTVETVLGGSRVNETPTWLGFWKLSGTFGAGKNKKPLETAPLYMEAISRPGITIQFLQSQAESLLASRSEQQFMPQLKKWLEEDAFLVPPSTPRQGAPNGNCPPAFRSNDAASSTRVARTEPAPGAGGDPASPFAGLFPNG